MSEPTEPTKPRTPKGAAKPPVDPATQGSGPEAASAPPAATQPLPAVSAAEGSGPVSPVGPGGAGGPGGGPGGPGTPGGYAAPGGPPPRRPGLWRQATSTTGGTIAVIVAGCLVALMVLALMGVAGLVAVRAIGHDDRSDRIERVGDGGMLPPGQQKKLDRLPKALEGQRGQRNGQGDGQGNGQGNGMGQGMGNGLGPLMREARGLGNVQHGEFTVEDNGKATVMTLQRGEVTKASATSITVKSADSFTATYAIGADTRGRATNLKVGDSVLVVAEKTGAKAVLVTGTRKD